MSGLSGAEKPPCRIPVPSRKKAMEWSLVLISQEIESTIEYDSEQRRWYLIVETGQGEKCRRALSLYIHENRGWFHWQRQALESFHLEFPWAVLGWAAFVIAVFICGERVDALKQAGVQDSDLAAQGEWWRLVTATTLHADLDHLISNIVSGSVMFSLCWSRFGVGLGVGGAILSGVGGNLFAWAFASHAYRSLGASGMVMGGLGMLAVDAVANWRRSPLPFRTVIGGFIAGCLLFVWFGTNPGSDVAAHLGGFLSGCLIGAFCGLFKADFRKRIEFQLIPFALGCGLVALSWTLAFKTLAP